MRTEDDLRTAFDHLADSSPDPHRMLDTLHRDHRPVRRDRPTLVIGVALATTAAAIAVPLAIRSQPDSAPQPAGTPSSSVVWQDRLTLPLPPQMIYDNRWFKRNSQGMILDGGSTNTTCLLTIYPQDAFDKGRIAAGSPETMVGDHKAYQVRTTTASQGGAAGTDIIWQPSPDTWATARCTVRDEDSPAKALEVARLVVTTPRQLPAPFRIGYLPTSQAVTALSVNPQNTSMAAAPNNFTATVSNGQLNPNKRRGKVYSQNPDGTRMEIPADLTDLGITYLTGAQAASIKPPKAQPDLHVNGHAAWYVSDGLIVKGDGFAVQVDDRDGVGRSELVKVAKGLDFAPDPDDTTTWFDAATAIP